MGSQDSPEHQKLAEEFYSLEQTYTNHLRNVILLYRHSLEQDTSCSQNLSQTIFRNVEEIYELHKEIFQDLQESPYPYYFVSVLKKFSPRMAMYKGYVVTAAQCNKILAAVRSHSSNPSPFFIRRNKISSKNSTQLPHKQLSSLLSLLQSIEQTHKQSLHGLKLEDLLIMPIQRLPRYVLLLNRLLQLIPAAPIHSPAGLITCLRREIEQVRDVYKDLNEDIDSCIEQQDLCQKKKKKTKKRKEKNKAKDKRGTAENIVIHMNKDNDNNNQIEAKGRKRLLTESYDEARKASRALEKKRCSSLDHKHLKIERANKELQKLDQRLNKTDIQMQAIERSVQQFQIQEQIRAETEHQIQAQFIFTAIPDHNNDSSNNNNNSNTIPADSEMDVKKRNRKGRDSQSCIVENERNKKERRKRQCSRVEEGGSTLDVWAHHKDPLRGPVMGLGLGPGAANAAQIVAVAGRLPVRELAQLWELKNLNCVNI